MKKSFLAIVVIVLIIVGYFSYKKGELTIPNWNDIVSVSEGDVREFLTNPTAKLPAKSFETWVTTAILPKLETKDGTTSGWIFVKRPEGGWYLAPTQESIDNYRYIAIKIPAEQEEDLPQPHTCSAPAETISCVVGSDKNLVEAYEKINAFMGGK